MIKIQVNKSNKIQYMSFHMLSWANSLMATSITRSNILNGKIKSSEYASVQLPGHSTSNLSILNNY